MTSEEFNETANDNKLKAQQRNRANMGRIPWGKVEEGDEDEDLCQTRRQTQSKVFVRAVLRDEVFDLFRAESAMECVEGLSGRPRETTPAHDMDMQMEDGLATVRPCIDDRSIAAIQTQQSRNFRNRHQKMAAKSRVLFRQFIQRRNGLFGNQQHMHRGLRIYIAKSKAMTVFVDNVGRDLTLNNFQENRHSISHCCRQFCLFTAELSRTTAPPMPVSSEFQGEKVTGIAGNTSDPEMAAGLRAGCIRSNFKAPVCPNSDRLIVASVESLRDALKNRRQDGIPCGL